MRRIAHHRCHQRSGMFPRRSVGEGDEVRACIATRSSTGVAGVMVRDSEAPSSPFVFAGIDASAIRWSFTATAPAIPSSISNTERRGMIDGSASLWGGTPSMPLSRVPRRGVAWSLGVPRCVPDRSSRHDVPNPPQRPRRFFFGSGAPLRSATWFQTEALFWTSRPPPPRLPAIFNSHSHHGRPNHPPWDRGLWAQTVLWRNGARGSATVDLPSPLPRPANTMSTCYCLAGNPLQIARRSVVGGGGATLRQPREQSPGAQFLALARRTTPPPQGPDRPSRCGSPIPDLDLRF